MAVGRIEDPLTEFRKRLAVASLVVLLVAGGISLLFARGFTARVDRLKRFSRSVAAGDFRPLPPDRSRDEISDLAEALNETAQHLDRTIHTLTDERNQSAAILRSMVEGVAVIGADQRIVFCNSAFAAVLSIDSQACEGRAASEVIRDPDLLEAVLGAVRTGESVRSDVTTGTAHPKNFAVTAAPVRSDGTTAGAVLVLHDITELRRLERARRDLVANVSHEFRTPLTAIRGFAETLLAGGLEDEGNRRRFLEIIRDHAVRLTRLTEDLLELARIEAGKLELDLRPTVLADVIEPCLETTRPAAAEREIELAAEYEADLPLVLADPRALEEILQNLLDNALRYTPAGGRVTVRAGAHDGTIALAVADTGIGIPPAEQERIFERFYRADASRARNMGGTGLGLSIVKHLVEAHAGRIDVESEVGRGTTFRVCLPSAGVLTPS
jgi:two-component system phosphate regulon sensor histidine kinase PhoR